MQQTIYKCTSLFTFGAKNRHLHRLDCASSLNNVH